MPFLNYVCINDELCLIMNETFNNTISFINEVLNDDFKGILNLKEYTDVVSINDESLLTKLGYLIKIADWDEDYSDMVFYFRNNMNILKYIKPTKYSSLNDEKYLMSGFKIINNKICHVEFDLTLGFFSRLFFKKICPKCYSYDVGYYDLYKWKWYYTFIEKENDYEYYRKTLKAPDNCKICHNNIYNDYITLIKNLMY